MSNASLVTNNLTMFFFGGVCAVLPIAVCAGMFFKFKALESKESLMKFGSLYKKLDLRKGRIIATVPTLYLVRRLSLAAAVTGLSSLIVQILTLFLGIIAQFAILGIQPHLDEKMDCKLKVSF